MVVLYQGVITFDIHECIDAKIPKIINLQGKHFPKYNFMDNIKYFLLSV